MKPWRCVSICLLVLLFSGGATAQQQLNLHDFSDARSVGSRLAYFEDAEGALTMSALLADGVDRSVWTDSLADTPNFGYSDSAYWFRLSLKNSGSQPVRRLFEVGYPVLDSVHFYLIENNRIVQQLQTGDRQPFSSRLVPHRHFLFPLELKGLAVAELYVRIRSSSSLQLPLSVGSETSFFVDDQSELTGQAIYFGIMFVMILFNLFFYFSLREPVYLYYILFVFSFTVVQLCLHGIPAQYLTPDLPLAQDKALLFFIPSIVFFAAWFTRAFLDLGQNAPRVDRFFQVAGWFAAGCMASALLFDYQTSIRFSIAAVIPVSLGCLLIGPTLWIKGHTIARFYTLAWVSITTAAILIALNKFGWIPRTFLTENGLQFGSAAEAILLSLALADRLNRERDERFRAQERSLLEINQRQLAEEKLVHAALHHPLTGMPNRAFFENWIVSDHLQSKEGDGLVFGLIHLARFHEVNKTLGHLKADELLSHISDNLNQEALSLSGIQILENRNGRAGAVASIEGVSFGLLLSLTFNQFAVHSIRKLAARMAEPVEFMGMMIDVGGICGVATLPRHTADAAALIRNAQIAIDMGLKAGRLLTEYSDEINPYSPRRLTLAGELRKAIAKNSLELYFQPQINAAQNKMTGMEALLRWKHAEYGFIGPDEFIPIAEQTGIIHPLTHWVVDEAVRRLSELHRKGMALSVSVNVSAINLKDRNFAEMVSRILAKYQVSPAHLVAEVTETAMMSDPERALSVLKQLNKIGVRISIDDFGTGYSSLSYIKQLPIQEIKIDRSFVMEMDKVKGDAIIVRTTINMCHDLGLKVVAEGVETQQSCNTLKAMGCDYLQGYFLSRPLPFEQLCLWLAQDASASSL
jgi:EAL domain-containing protein (putative c-di-GMP-specific phosphodiesterase class I)/GGDEF domain-containing protein